MKSVSRTNKIFGKKPTSLGEVDVPSDRLWGHKRNVPWSISTLGRI